MISRSAMPVSERASGRTLARTFVRTLIRASGCGGVRAALAAAGASCALLIPATVSAVELEEGSTVRYSQRDLGGVGLLQMPSARMNPEGQLNFFLNYTWPYTRGGFVAQPVDWLEVLFRYSNVGNRLYGPRIAGDQDFKDKGIDVKFRLLEESYWLPQLALGFQDAAGTGLFSAEYLVASKQWRNFDFTLGLGWGYLGNRGGISNPMAELSDRFLKRQSVDTADVIRAGRFSFSNYFSGKEIAPFAGVEYRPDWAPVTVKLELDGNDYQNEGLRNRFEQSSPLNLGVVYHLSPGVDLHAGIERGNELMFGISLGANFQRDRGQRKLFDTKPEPVQSSVTADRNKPTEVDWAALSRRLEENAGWKVSSIRHAPGELVLAGEQGTYLDRAKGVGRASRILSNELDADTSWFSFVEENRNLALNQVTVDRARFEQAAEHRLDPRDPAAVLWASPVEQHGTLLYQTQPARFTYEVAPGLIQNFGGPDGFLLYQVSANLLGELRLTRNHWLSGMLVAGIADNFDKFDYTAPSKLPRVRTHIREYLTTSRVRLENLQMNWLQALEQDWYALGYAGYLEGMYAGVGGELLYRPYGRRWALGLDLNYVRQRNFDMHFGLRDYGIVTGHASAYYQLPWTEGVHTEVNVGRYLAGDLGATFTVAKTFMNNVKVGAWATFTDVSSEQFGEGSFDKGFFINVPFDFFFAGSSTRRAQLNWNFLTRDGGQRLGRSNRLVDITALRDVDQLYRGMDQLMD